MTHEAYDDVVLEEGRTYAVDITYLDGSPPVSHTGMTAEQLVKFLEERGWRRKQ